MRQIFSLQADARGAAPDGRFTPGPLPGQVTATSPEADELAARLAEAYASPEGTWVRANLITSMDGAVSVDGRSGGLSGAADRLLFHILRALADVILVGAGTVRAEHYGLAKLDWPSLRTGRPATAPIAIVTRQFDLDLDSALLRGDADHPKTIVLTGNRAAPGRVAKAAETAEVITFPGADVSGKDAIGKLSELGFRNILIEGGPMLLGQLVTEDLLDELCLTIAPLLEGGLAGRMITGGSARTMRLASVIEDDGFLLCRYLRGT